MRAVAPDGEAIHERDAAVAAQADGFGGDGDVGITGVTRRGAAQQKGRGAVIAGVEGAGIGGAAIALHRHGTHVANGPHLLPGVAGELGGAALGLQEQGVARA